MGGKPVSKVLEVERADVDKIILLSEKFSHIATELKAAVDLSIVIRRESPQSKHETILLWEKFLSQLFGYIKQRSKETKDNLLSGVSLTRLKLF